MKIRKGFVSNSSSSSFIIGKSNLSPNQIQQIKNHSFQEDCNIFDGWKIEETENYIEGSTSMDNFDMEYYLTNIVGVQENNIKWCHS